MKRITDALAYLWSLQAANMRGYGPERNRLLILSFFMIVQNSLFFALWIVFFRNVSNLKGWDLTDVARMYGLIASSVGISLFFFNGARTIAYRLQDGSIDAFLTRPRAALPMLLLSASSPASLGDICYGPLIWIALGKVNWALAPQLIGLTLISSVLFTSMTLLFYSIAFWLKNNTRFPEQLFEVLIIFSCNILHGQPFGVQLIMYTVVPAAFITLLPTRLIGAFDPVLLAELLAATVFYAWLSARVFYAGIRRYKNTAA